MITLHYKKLRCTALILLAIPSVIFMLTWLKPLVGIPAVILLCAALFLASKTEDREIKIKASTLIALAVLILIWAFLSGQGGFFTQKSDYEIRNVIFRDLIQNPWPVRYNEAGDVSLVYYIGYWLLPALIGKAFVNVGGFAAGWLAARIAILIWTVILIYVAFLLVLFKVGKGRKKVVYITLAVFVLFSGMDAIMSLAAPQRFLMHIEWWAGYFQYSSMSTQLCWVFNQAVPAWLACAVAFNEKDEKAFALIGLLLLSTSPLPLVGLAVYLLAFGLRDFVKAVKGKEIGSFFKNVFTPQNLLAVIVLLPVYALYYGNNAVTAENPATASADSNEYSAVYFIIYVLFVVFEFGALLYLLRNKKNRFDSLVIFGSLMVIPFIKVGTSIDFCMRASIPALFLLMMMLIEYLTGELTRKKDKNEDKKSPEYLKRTQRFMTVMLIFIIGCVTPLVEYTSSARDYIQTKGACVTRYDTMESLTEIPIEGKKNFVGTDSSNSAFYKYIGK